MQKVCVQGLGFVGAAMAYAVALARDESGKPVFDVIGIDLPSAEGDRRVRAINDGEFPFDVNDPKLRAAIAQVHEQSNLSATTENTPYGQADIIVVDIHQDIDFEQDQPLLDFTILEKAIATIGKVVKEGALILIETTVPPGTCETVIRPLLDAELGLREMSPDSVFLAHSYERVMPGAGYLDSIISFWRVFAADDQESAAKCARFLSSFIDTDKYPLTQLSSMRASETSKVLENTYRAANIAFIDEWTKYAEEVGIDLFEVIDAIKVRPTHSNMMRPGLGVGGYCLTKDPAFTPAAAKKIFKADKLQFPFSALAIKTNNAMPEHAAQRLIRLMEGRRAPWRILLCGVSYRQDIGDTRYSATETLLTSLQDCGAQVVAHDPYVTQWELIDTMLTGGLPPAADYDAVVLCVSHEQYRELDYVSWMKDSEALLFDANGVLAKADRNKIRESGVRVEALGIGEGL